MISRSDNSSCHYGNYRRLEAQRKWDVTLRKRREIRGIKPEKRLLNMMTGYRDHFWSFENSDANGQLDMGWANNGKLNLRSLDWKTKLEGSITFAFARKMQFSYVHSTGGYWALREADKTYNDWNREQLRALKMMHGRLFLGSINFHGDQRKKVIAGKEGVYEELLDQMVYNFGCDFAVPTPDKKLEELIRAWNGDERLPKRLVDVEAMTGRVEQLGGLNMIWY